ASRLQVVGLFAVLGDVQPVDFLLFGYAKAGHQIHHFQNDDGADDRERPREQNAYHLVADLAPMPVQTADCSASAKNWVDGHSSADASEQGADRAACAVNSE